MTKVKTIIFLILFFILIFMTLKVYATMLTLGQIANAFNNCLAVKELNKFYTLKATTSENKLHINDGDMNLEYVLNGDILSCVFSSGDKIFDAALASNILIDSIETLQGYEEGEMFSTLNDERINNYTLQNEGLEVTIDKLKQETTIKIDITKKVPLLDFSETYISVSDLIYLKERISGDGIVEKNKGNIYFNKIGEKGKNTVFVAEKENITNNTYKTILSIIEVMFDSNKVLDYFKLNYSGMDMGNKEFIGFKIEKNPTKIEMEEDDVQLLNNYKFTKITINKDDILTAINNSEDLTSDDYNITKMPRTGIEVNTILVFCYISNALAILGVVILTIKLKYKK